MAGAGIESVLTSLWLSTVEFLPKITGALVILVIGFILGKLLGRIIREVLIKLKIDEFLSEEKYLYVKPSHIGDLVARWTIYLVFIRQAAVILEVQAISDFVTSAYSFILGVVAAVITILIGYGLAVYLKDKIITSRTVYSDITGKLVFGIVLYLSIAIGLKFIQGIDTQILENILLVLIASFGVGIAIALGLGLKDVVAEIAKEWLKAGRRTEKKRR